MEEQQFNPCRYDIYVAARRPYGVAKDWRLYDDNAGLGYSQDEAHAKLDSIRRQRIRLGIKEFVHTIKMRGFDKIPKCYGENDWGFDGDPNEVEIDPDAPVHYTPQDNRRGIGERFSPEPHIEVEKISLDLLRDAEEELGDLLDPPW